MAATHVVLERPGTADEVAAVLAQGRVTRPVGGRTKLDWGAVGAPAEVELSTERLDALVEHNEGDLTAVLQAGVKLRHAQEAFAHVGQRLALDPPDPGDRTTIGGLIASGDSGPLRHRYGAIRDLILGVRVALPDGTVARAGSRVIKNVAGYDLAKLMCGALGTLGVICEAIVRLHPKPSQTITVVGYRGDASALTRAARLLAGRPLELEALDVRWEGEDGAVLAQAGGHAAPATAQTVLGLLSAEGLETELHEDDQAVWASQRMRQRCPEGGRAVVRVSFPPAELERVLNVAPSAVARAGAGLAWLTIAPEPEALQSLRVSLAGCACVLLDAPMSLRREVDPWGVQAGPELELMARVKAGFDPGCVCNRGRFVGGL